MTQWTRCANREQARALEDSIFERIRRRLIAKYQPRFFRTMPGKEQEHRLAEKLIGLGAYSARAMKRIIDERAGSSAKVLKARGEL
ncbi:unnamed protein product [marine sediment metagenome]|uniref:Uncharacterized protein n=1 Tax=marine sediment metagenome TaxID=412755 RepID=X0TCF7_9ZZZZ